MLNIVDLMMLLLTLDYAADQWYWIIERDFLPPQRMVWWIWSPSGLAQRW